MSTPILICGGALTAVWTRWPRVGRTWSSTSGGCKNPAGSSPPLSRGTLGFTHLQFEALLTAARESANRYDFALVAMLGLLGLRIFEATGTDIADLGEEHGHRVLRVYGKGTKIVPVPLPPAVGRPSTAP